MGLGVKGAGGDRGRVAHQQSLEALRPAEDARRDPPSWLGVGVGVGGRVRVGAGVRTGVRARVGAVGPTQLRRSAHRARAARRVGEDDRLEVDLVTVRVRVRVSGLGSQG